MAAAEWNMALDEALLNNFKDGDLPILRFYMWKPSITLGRFSNAQRSLNMDGLEGGNISPVRRMSGGGVLVHGGDLSYSLIMPKKCLQNRGVKESYRYLCGFLINTYEKLGHNAQYANDLNIEYEKSDICLAGIESYDIIINGKKIGGNAQRYRGDILFQQGSIPLKEYEERFKTLFVKDPGFDKTNTLEGLGNFLTCEKLIELLKETFCETFDAELLKGSVNSSEDLTAKNLLSQKYTQERWNIHAESNRS